MSSPPVSELLIEAPANRHFAQLHSDPEALTEAVTLYLRTGLGRGNGVVVIAGRDKGKRGDVARIVDDSHVLVNGINAMKKHAKPNPMKNQPGGIISKEMPIHVSNIAIWNPVTQAADRIGFRIMDDGRKLRFYKSNGELINA